MPRQEYHPVQGAYVDKSAPPDPFIVSLKRELDAIKADDPNHRAEPIGIPSLCRICGKPTRQWPDGRFPIHASV
jgi:hypothetical protein